MSAFRPLKDYFEVSSVIRGQHLLWLDLLSERVDILPSNGNYKLAFYLWLAKNELNAVRGKDEMGNLGYGLKFIDVDYAGAQGINGDLVPKFKDPIDFVRWLYTEVTGKDLNIEDAQQLIRDYEDSK